MIISFLWAIWRANNLDHPQRVLQLCKCSYNHSLSQTMFLYDALKSERVAKSLSVQFSSHRRLFCHLICTRASSSGRGTHEPQISEGVKEPNNLIPQSRTKAQRPTRKNCLVFFAPSTPLSRVRGMKCFCSPGDFFTPSQGLLGIRCNSLREGFAQHHS